MDKIVSTPVQDGFQNPQALFAGLGADAIALLAQAGADVALILDADGRIVEAASSDRVLSALASGEWVGRELADIVTVESREKIAELLQEARKTPTTRARHVNHPGGRGPDVPISYRIVSFAGGAHRVALGRDLRTMADIQQRLIRAQVEMEKDLRKMRDVESRYRILFHLAQEPLIVLDAQTMRILDANEGASRLLDRPVKKLLGAPVAARPDGRARRACLDRVALEGGHLRSAPGDAR
jgi:transcriptional regulator PpsR